MTTQIHVEPADHETELCALMRQYGSDKCDRHDYSRYYHAVFSQIRQQTTRVFELGIFGGASLRAWRDYFPSATVLGADIDPAHVAAMQGEPRITAKQCDETDVEQIDALWAGEARFDIMIDDALHTLADNVFFFGRSKHMLRPGGIYVIEDVPESEIYDAKAWTVSRRRHGWAAHLLMVPRTDVPDNNLIVLRAP